MALPQLQVSELPPTPEEDSSNTASPARGREMRQNLLSKLRSPPLVHSWEFWHDRQSRTKAAPPISHVPSQTNHTDDGAIGKAAEQSPPGKYEDRLVHLTSISDVRAFWSTFNNFDIMALPLRDSIHLFHKGVKPVWEDPRNVQGGSWTFRVPKEKAVEVWKEICLMAIGEQLQAAVASSRVKFIDDICGISLSVRFTSILIQIWNRDAKHKEGVERILATVLKNISPELKPNNAAYYYKAHKEHAGFNVSPTKPPPGNPNSAFGPSLTTADSMPQEATVPPIDDPLHAGTEHRVNEHTADMESRTSRAPVTASSGAMHNAEILQANEDTLCNMKEAMDRIGGLDAEHKARVEEER